MVFASPCFPDVRRYRTAGGCPGAVNADRYALLTVIVMLGSLLRFAFVNTQRVNDGFQDGGRRLCWSRHSTVCLLVAASMTW